MSDRVQIVHENFIKRLKVRDLPESRPKANGDKAYRDVLYRCFNSQLVSRHLDMQARKMQARGSGYYTIGSAGHEGNAALAEALLDKDISFLHYRDAAFFIHRALLIRNEYPIRDLLLSFAAAKDDPIASGRHKVLGAKDLNIPPQTSTIASHLPKAVGTAFGIGLNKKLKHKGALDHDAIVMCSFGDASVNHSTALGAFNSAQWSARQGAAMPILFVCEDNGIGISTRTPHNWIQDRFDAGNEMAYFHADGLSLTNMLATSQKAADYVRRTRKPAFLHMSCIRLYGHAGADMQSAYMNDHEITDIEANDPLLHSARELLETGIASAEELLGLYTRTGGEIAKASREMDNIPRLESAKEVAASLIPSSRKMAAALKISQKKRKHHFGSDTSLMNKPQHMARLLNWSLHDLMLEYPEIVMMGEDIGPKGGVYNITSKCHEKFGSSRVINSLLDEQSILGLAIGMAHNNILPIAEIQFLAYLHNAIDQLRGEAATLPFFSNGQYTNPLIIRIAGLAYQKGFGGHFHNDNSFAAIRDIPGVILACPSNGVDASAMMRESVRLARQEQRVVVFLEPIALYMTRDLHEDKDNGWCFTYHHNPDRIKIGDIGVHGEGRDLAIISYGNGYYRSRQAARILEKEKGIQSRVIDLRWLAPLNIQAIIHEVRECAHILIVDETRRTGSLSEELLTRLIESGLDQPVERLTAQDCFIPLGRAFEATLPKCADIVKKSLEILKS
mgnify:CR=1 FL=1